MERARGAARARLRPVAARQAVAALRRVLLRKNKLLEKVKRKLKTLKKKYSKTKATFHDASSQTDSVASTASTEAQQNTNRAGWDVAVSENTASKKSIAEQVKEVAQNAMMQTGMVYVESAGMYYDYKSGYYYNSELGLYYHSSTGCYYYYSEDNNEFTYHSHADTSHLATSHRQAAAAPPVVILPQTEQLLRKKESLKKHKKENEDAEKNDAPTDAKRRKHSKKEKKTNNRKFRKGRSLKNGQVNKNGSLELTSENEHDKHEKQTEISLPETMNTKDNVGNKVGLNVDKNDALIEAVTDAGVKLSTSFLENVESTNRPDVEMADDIESKGDNVVEMTVLNDDKDLKATVSNSDTTEVRNDNFKDVNNCVTNLVEDEDKIIIVQQDKIEANNENSTFKDDYIEAKDGKSSFKDDNIEAKDEKSSFKDDNIEAKDEKSSFKDDNIEAKDEKSSFKDDNIEAKDEKSSFKDDNIEAKDEKSSFKDDNIEAKDEKSSFKDDNIEAKDEKSSFKDDNIEAKDEKSSFKDDNIEAKDEKSVFKDDKIEAKEKKSVVKEDKIVSEDQKIPVNIDQFESHNNKNIEAKDDTNEYKINVKEDTCNEMEDGECSDTCSEAASDSDSTSSDSTVTDVEDSVVKHHPPGMRIIVRETNLPKMKVGSLFLVTKDGGTLGREGEDHAVLIRDENVSRIHLQFIYNDKKRCYDAIDLGSKNGTILNGIRMSKSQEVSAATEIVHGSIIQIGETKLLCHIHPGNDTCGHCEPGLIMAEDDKTKRQAYTRTCDLKKQHALELARLKNRYAPEPLAIEDGSYKDRAKARRDKVGSTHDAEKTQQNDLTTTITEDNKGFQMLAKMGWSKGEGLGKELQGEKEPVPLVSNEGTAGLGAGGTGAPAVRPAMKIAARPRPRLRPAASAFRDPLEEDD